MSKPITDKEIGLIRSGSRLSVQVCLVDRSLNPIQFSLHALLSLWSTLNSDNCCPLLRFEIRLIAEQKAEKSVISARKTCQVRVSARTKPQFCSVKVIYNKLLRFLSKTSDIFIKLQVNSIEKKERKKSEEKFSD